MLKLLRLKTVIGTGIVAFMLPFLSAAQYCTTNLHSVACSATDNINTVTIAGTTLNNANTGCSATTGQAYTAYPATGSTTATLARQVTYNLSVTSTANSIMSVWIDYNQNNTFEASEWKQISTTSTAGTAVTIPITIPATAVLGQTGMRIRSRLSGNTNGSGDACTTMGSGETEDYIITIGPAPVCTTPVTPGTVTGATAICSGQTATLTLSGQTLGTTLQWQSSPNGTTWTDITGANNFTFTTPALTSSTYYRVNVTCGTSTVPTTSVQVILTTGAITTFPHTQNFDGVTAPAVPCGWTILNANSDPKTWETAASNPSSAPNALRYSYSVTLPADDWAFSPPIAMNAANQYLLTFKYRVQSASYPEALEVKVGNAATVAAMTTTLFTNTSLTNTTYATATATISPGSTGNQYIGFHAFSLANQWDLFVDDITITELSSCTGTPTPGTVPTSPLAICAGNVNTITATGATQGSGITYQWEQATSAAGPWTNVTGGSGANTATYTLPTTLTATTFYRLKVTCAGTNTATTTAVQVNINPPLACYCSANLHSIACSATDNINDVSIAGTTLSNLNTGCSSTTGQAYTAYPATGSTTATLIRQQTYNLSVTSTANSIMSVWIDFNQNGTFEATEWTQIATTSTAGTAVIIPITIPATAVLGQTGMRIRSRLSGNINGAVDACTTMGSGETEDYIVTIGAASPCTLPVAPGTVTGTLAVCSGQTTTLLLGGQTLGTNLQWQSSPNGTTWTDITGAINPSFTTPALTTATFYRVNVTCGTSTVPTPSVQATIKPTIACYCSANLHSVACSATDNINTVTIAGTTLNNANTGCSSTSGQAYTAYPPTGATTASLQKLSTYNLSVTSTANSIMSVWIDYNQNGTFEATEWTQIATTSTAGTAVTIPITIPASAVLGQTGMRIRSRFSGNANGATDACTTMGSGETEDYIITIAPACTAAATPTITAGGSTTICTGGSVALTAASTTPGATYVWSLNGNVITGATSATYTANAAGSYTVIATANNCPSAPSTATTVTVNAKPATPTITQNGGTLTSSATTGNQWYLNGNPISGATGQTLITTSNGAYTVVTTGTNGCASAQSAVRNVTNTGINDALAGMSIEVYPNPTSGSFNVKLNGYQKGASVVLYNLAGQQIASETAKAGQQVKPVNVKGLAAGIYMVKVTSDQGVQVTRLIVE